MRHITRVTLAIVLCVSLVFTVIPCASAAYAETAVVNNPNPSDRLNLRSSPSTNASASAKYYNGVTVTVNRYVGSDWVHVTIGSVDGQASGYMLRSYLAFGSNQYNVRSAIPTMYVTTANGGRVTMRAGMSASQRSLGAYPVGTPVEVLGFGSTWHHVRINGQTGFIMAQYLTASSNGGVNYNGGGNGSIVGMSAVVNNPNPNDRLNLRTSYSSSSSSFAKFYNGTPVTIVGDVNDQWVKVQIGYGIGAVFGYMMKSYMAFGERAAYVTRNLQRYYRYASSWSLYGGATYGAVVVGRFSSGIAFDRLGIRESDNWWYVCVYDSQGAQHWGWINAMDMNNE